jgi:hypothetical protein
VRGAVDGEGGVVEGGEEQGCDVVRGGWEGVAGGFGVVERDDQGVVGVGEGAVPFVVVALVADAEAAAVDGEEGWEGGGRGLVVGGGEEDAGKC